MLRRYPAMTSPRRQTGAVALMAALTMTTLLLFLAFVIDTGRLFLEKRSLQKNADLAALETSLMYCRDQTLDDAGRLAVALDVLSETRNNFLGGNENVQVTLGIVQRVADGSGGFVRQFTADSSGKAVQVQLSNTVSASLFQQLWPTTPNSITMQATGAAQACEPTAQLTLRTNLVSIDTSRSDLLNAALGGMLGSSLNLAVASWQGLLDANINLLSYLDALATEVGVSAGDYDSLLSTSVSTSDLLSVAADVAADGGNTIAANALDEIELAVPFSTPSVQLGDILNIQSDATEAALNADINALDLAQAFVQLANKQNGLVVEVPISLLGLADATVRLNLIEPPQISAIGNPARAKLDPYGADAIAVSSAQVRAFISLDLPIVGSVLSTLNSLLSDPLISAVTSTVNSLLTLDLVGLLNNILCLVSCTTEEDMLDIDILASPRVDIAINAGAGEARVSDYDCDVEDKALTVPVTSAVVDRLALGQFGTSMEDASANVFASDDFDVNPIPLLDFGSVHVRKSCGLLGLGCTINYQKGAGWTSDISQADRVAFAAGGLGIKVDSNLGSSSSTLTYYNSPSETYLPEVKETLTEDAYQSLSSTGLVNSLEGTLTGVSIEVYEPQSSAFQNSATGLATTLIGSTVNTLVSSLSGIISSALGPLLDGVIDTLLETLGIQLAETEVGGALTCENDKVKLVM